MSRPRHLANAPITEALIDFRVEPPQGFRAEVLRTAIARHKAEYPVSEERTGKEAFVEFIEGRSTTQVKDLGFQGIWLWSEDRRNLAQFRTDGFTFNRLRPYSSWESLLPEAMRLWQSYVDLVHPESVVRLAVRYINQIDLDEPVGDLGDFLATAPRLPGDSAQVLTGFLTRIVIEHPALRLSANVTQALESRVDTRAITIFLDIDAYRAGSVAPAGPAIEDIFEQLRHYKNQIFFSSLTDKLLSRFE